MFALRQETLDSLVPLGVVQPHFTSKQRNFGSRRCFLEAAPQRDCMNFAVLTPLRTALACLGVRRKTGNPNLVREWRGIVPRIMLSPPRNRNLYATALTTSLRLWSGLEFPRATEAFRV